MPLPLFCVSKILKLNLMMLLSELLPGLILVDVTWYSNATEISQKSNLLCMKPVLDLSFLLNWFHLGFLIHHISTRSVSFMNNFKFLA